MAIKLQIRKKAGNVWLHYKVDDNKNILISRFTARWVGDTMEITEESGVDNAVFDISEIGVYDDTASGTEETFVTSLALAQRLKTLGYTAFYDDADVVIADLISTDASNIIVLGTDGKLYAPSGGGSGTVTSVAVSGSDGIEVDSGSPITTSGTIALGINASTLRSHINVEDGAEVNDVDSVNGETGTVVLTEEDIDGTATEDATLTGAESIDLSTHVDAYYTLTGNTTISVTNTPSADISFVRTWTIESNGGTETLTLPGTWVVIGTYDPSVVNYLTINFSNYTTQGAVVVCYINQDD